MSVISRLVHDMLDWVKLKTSSVLHSWQYVLRVICIFCAKCNGCQ